MPLPLLIWVAIAAASAIGGAAAGAALVSDDEDLDDEEDIDIVILGPNTTGKTTLANFIAYGSGPEENEEGEASIYPDILPAFRSLELKALEMKIGQVMDVPGSKGRYESWEQCIRKGGIVLYLLRIDNLMKDEKGYTPRIREDVGQIGKWLKNNKKDYPVFIIGTHCDKIDNDFNKLALNNMVSNKIRKIEDQVRQEDIYSHIKKHFLASGSKIRLLCGSLKSTKNIQNVVYRMLKEIDFLKKINEES